MTSVAEITYNEVGAKKIRQALKCKKKLPKRDFKTIMLTVGHMTATKKTRQQRLIRDEITRQQYK